MTGPRDDETVRELLDGAGLPATAAEVAALARVYRELAGPLAALHAVRADHPVLEPVIPS
jgi:hypothetical protein